VNYMPSRACAYVVLTERKQAVRAMEKAATFEMHGKKPKVSVPADDGLL